MDVVYGPYWFAGPGYAKRHLIYPDTTRTKAKLEDGSEVWGESEGEKGEDFLHGGKNDFTKSTDPGKDFFSNSSIASRNSSRQFDPRDSPGQ